MDTSMTVASRLPTPFYLSILFAGGIRQGSGAGGSSVTEDSMNDNHRLPFLEGSIADTGTVLRELLTRCSPPPARHSQTFGQIREGTAKQRPPIGRKAQARIGQLQRYLFGA